MAEIKHSWFDCDGTLYKETPELQARRMNAILNELQRRTHRSASDLSGEYKQKLRKRGTNTLALKDYGLTPDEARTVYNSVDVLKFIEPDPRLIRMMKQLLDSGVDISVFTNNKRSRLLDIIEKIGLSPDWFKFLMTAEEVEPKPSAEGYREIVRRSEHPPYRLLFVGDREHADIIPAREQGMNTLLVYAREAELEVDGSRGTYHYKRETIYELSDIIAELNAPGARQSLDR